MCQLFFLRGQYGKKKISVAPVTLFQWIGKKRPTENNYKPHVLV